MKWSKHEIREPKRRHKPIVARVEERERVSSWKARPVPGDSVTVVLRDGQRCAQVTVREKGRGVSGGWFVYSTKSEITTATNKPLLSGVVGMARYADRGVTWAWGWTTSEARALQVAAALR